jgi:hypothetical protein
MRIILRTFAVATLACAAGTAAEAQSAALEPSAPEPRSRTAGFHLGLSLNGSALRVEDVGETEAGPGIGAHVGYGFTPSTAVFARVDLASMKSGDLGFSLAHADVGLRFWFGDSSSALRPFLQAGVGGRSVSFDDVDLATRGITLTGGGGLEYFVSQDLSIEGGLLLSWGEFSQGRAGDSGWVDLKSAGFLGTSARASVGFSWHP